MSCNSGTSSEHAYLQTCDKSTASCSSPKELTQAVPPHDAVLTLKEVVLRASPMAISNRIRFLSGVALVTRLSPISHLMARDELLPTALQALADLGGVSLRESPRMELDLRPCEKKTEAERSYAVPVRPREGGSRGWHGQARLIQHAVGDDAACAGRCSRLHVVDLLPT
ncbi:hypothetical protein BHM03_00055366 [Ensete ventricosum]|nr:hypothetical protein BHM03_00055366 [Ensete ventricosum]